MITFHFIHHQQFHYYVYVSTDSVVSSKLKLLVVSQRTVEGGDALEFNRPTKQIS